MINEILICIPTYNRNISLINCIKSIIKLKDCSFSNVKILIVDNSINNNSYNVVKKLNKKISLKIYQAHEKKRGIVFARNKCLQIARKLKSDYIAFIDDDCVVNKNWLKNIYRLFNKIDADVLTGPQLHKNRINDNYAYLFEKKHKGELLKVKWAASNNVIFKFDILRKLKNIKFDKTLNNFGMGEDQLFFLIINKIGYKIYWSKKISVTEEPHPHRSNLDWVKERSKRLGILGHYLDLKMHGKIMGFLINYIKSFYFLFLSILIFINIFNINRSLDFNNHLFRFYGKLIGPFMIKKIKFLNISKNITTN